MQWLIEDYNSKLGDNIPILLMYFQPPRRGHLPQKLLVSKSPLFRESTYNIVYVEERLLGSLKST